MKKPINPHKPGSISHSNFSTFVSWNTRPGISLGQLVCKAKDIRKDAQDYCRYSWKQMSEMEFEASVIEKIIMANL